MKYMFRKLSHPKNQNEPQNWGGCEVSDTLSIFDNTEARTPILIVEVRNEDIHLADISGFDRI